MATPVITSKNAQKLHEKLMVQREGDFPGLFPYVVGKTYLIQTATNYYTGVVLAADDRYIVLADAALIPSTGRFYTAVASGDMEQVEPFPDDVTVNVAQGGVIASFQIPATPRTAK